MDIFERSVFKSLVKNSGVNSGVKKSVEIDDGKYIEMTNLGPYNDIIVNQH